MPPLPGLCFHCGYDLRATTDPRCPECGQPFDPQDPRTTHHGTRRISPLARKLLHPLGIPTLLAAALATLALLIITGFPGTLRPSLIEFRYYFAWDSLHTALSSYSLPWNWNSPTAWTFIASITLWGFIIPCALLRLTLRSFLILRHRIRANIARAPKRLALFATLLLLAAALQFVGWPNRLARHILYRDSAANPGPAEVLAVKTSYDHDAAGYSLDDTDCEQVLRYAASHLPFAHDRTAAIRPLYDHRLTSPSLLYALLQHERNPQTHLTILRLMAFAMDERAIPTVLQTLDSPIPEQRATALDIIGISRRGPGFETAYALLDYPRVMASDPPIWLTVDDWASPETSVPDMPPAIAWPPALRNRIAQLAQSAPTAPERQAAMRVLVTWPPESYQLRYAEWGVWLADGAQVKLAQSVIDEIPPFVHRTGDLAADMKDRLHQAFILMTITKPIVHMTASEPLYATLEVQIAHGRPWFAFPVPDDYALTPLDETRMWSRPVLPAPHPGSLAALDPKNAPKLSHPHSGVPWIVPHQQTRKSINVAPDPDLIESCGLRWNALHITPALPSTTKLPEVPPDPKFAWWKRLRAVPSSYITNQEETERFLYYDGPTLATLPFTIALTNDHHIQTVPVVPGDRRSLFSWLKCSRSRP